MKTVTLDKVVEIMQDYLLPEVNSGWFAEKVFQAAEADLPEDCTDEELEAYIDDYLNA